MKKLTLEQKLRRLIRSEIKSLNESSTPTPNLSSLKKGDIAWRVMDRYNPQLGTYYTFEKRTVLRITSSSIIVDSGYSEEKYNKNTGARVDKVSSVYGSSTYTLFDERTAKEYYRYLQDSDRRVRGM